MESDTVDVNLACGIMCAPWDNSRWKNSLRIQERLNDNGIPTHITQAKETESVWETRSRMMERAPDAATHLITLQDDVMLTENFEALVHDAVEARPDKLVALFLSARRSEVEAAQADSKHWVRTPGAWGQAIVLRTDWIPSINAFADQYTKPDMTADDYIISMWIHYVRDELVWTAQPSLVEHVGHDKSALGNSPPMDRTAMWFEKDVTVDDVDFSDTDNTPRADTPFSHRRMGDSINCDPDDISIDSVL